MHNNRRNLKIAALFSYIENVHLIKDPGMIPLTFKKSYGYDVVIPIWNDREYPYKDVYFENVEFPILKSGDTCTKRKLNMLKWLLSNAKSIDILHLYFFDRWTWIYMGAYKLRNKKGLIYVHCDTDGDRLLEYEFTKSKIKSFVLKKILLSERNINDVLWGVQNMQNCKKVQKLWPFKHVEYVPNGFWWKNYVDVPYEEKNNVILTVARNGTPPKKTEILLEGFAAIAPEFPGWTLKLVGTVEDRFQDYIHDYFIRYPELKHRVVFSGPVANRDDLQKIYSKAKVFCLTSAWEGFGLVTIEAMSNGCFIVESDIPANIDATRNGTYGVLFKSGDVNDFIDKLRSSLSDEEKMKNISMKSKDYVQENFSWEKVLKPVDEWISKRYIK